MKAHFLIFAIVQFLIIQYSDGKEKRSKATNQLLDWKSKHLNNTRAISEAGCPVPSLTASLSVGEEGPLLLQDNQLIQHLAHFNRERIPERVVHAKGGGAFGYFEVTNCISQYTKAKIFTEVGKKTPIAMRFSTVAGELGSSDTVRDPRGFAIKFYTEDGNYDLVGNNIPIFFVRDPILFPSFIHSQKRNPQTNLKNPDSFWDFFSLRPETMHQFSFLFSDRGIPDGFRHMHGYGSHTYKFVNSHDEVVYIKYHMKTDQGIRNIVSRNASVLASSNPDYAIEDLYNAIAEGNFPSWKMYIQVMTFEEAKKYKYNPFDLTKVWLHADFPLQPVGRLVLNKNAKNYFAEIEQLAFSPANFIPGIEASPDKMLQGRLFSYDDAHRYRLGSNFAQLRVNYHKVSQKNYLKNGLMDFDLHDGEPNYYPNSFHGPEVSPEGKQSVFKVTGDVIRKDTGDEDNYSQTNIFWRKVLTEDKREILVQNICHHLKNAAKFIRTRSIERFYQVNKEYGSRVEKCILKECPEE